MMNKDKSWRVKTIGEFTEEEKEKAEKLAEELREKIELYFPKECTDQEMDEIKNLRRELENMGFLVIYTGSLDPQTFAFKAEVTLLVPKQIH